VNDTWDIETIGRILCRVRPLWVIKAHLL